MPEPILITGPAEFEEALAVRYAVFCDEQGIPREVERDAEDNVATHALIRDPSGRAVATGRALRQLADGRLVGLRDAGQPDDLARIGRMAVRAEARRQQLGAKILSLLERTAHAAGLRTATLHAQMTAVPFYRACGYIEQGDVFMEENIPHVEMVKRLGG